MSKGISKQQRRILGLALGVAMRPRAAEPLGEWDDGDLDVWLDTSPPALSARSSISRAMRLLTARPAGASWLRS